MCRQKVDRTEVRGDESPADFDFFKWEEEEAVLVIKGIP